MNRCAIIVTDQLLLPAWSGNRVRILNIIRALRGLGWRVVLVTVQQNKASDLRGVIDRVFYVKGQTFLGGDLSGFDTRPFSWVLAEVAALLQPAMVIAEYAWLAPAMLPLPRAVLRCVDCHDVLSERTARFRAAGLDPWVVCTPELERALLGCADVLIAIQHREAGLLERLVPGKRVVCLLPHIELPANFQRTSPDAPLVLAVGANHAGNEGIRRFALSHWPRVLEKVPEARLRIVGRIGEGLGTLPGVEVLGTVTDLFGHYASAAVVVCPVEVGTGAKIKTLEALRHGRAVVATAEAVEGFPAARHPAWLMEETLEGCARTIPDLLADPAARDKLEDAAFAYGEQHLSVAAFLTHLRPLLPGWLRMSLAALTAQVCKPA